MTAEALVDPTAPLQQVGKYEYGAAALLVPVGRGDAVRGEGGPGRRESEPPTPRLRDIFVSYVPLGLGIKAPARNFQ